MKRLRPIMSPENGAAESFDYTRENYTPLLWMAEGVTSYYDELILRWAGLATPDEYLETVAQDYKEYLETPGRHCQSLEEASFDTWIKFYRQNENSRNTTISYYLKGALVGLCLDLEIRHSSGGRRSLNDLMRALYRDAFRGRGAPYTTADVRRTAEALSGKSQAAFFRRYVAGTDELDLERFLAYAGLELAPKRDPRKERKARPYLGIEWKKENGRVVVGGVLTGTPAMRAGLYAGDEILAVDGIRIDEGTFTVRLGERKPGARARFLVARRELVREIPVTLGEKPETEWSIVPKGRATPAQRQLYERWLREPWKPRRPVRVSSRKREPRPGAREEERKVL